MSKLIDDKAINKSGSTTDEKEKDAMVELLPNKAIRDETYIVLRSSESAKRYKLRVLRTLCSSSSVFESLGVRGFWVSDFTYAILFTYTALFTRNDGSDLRILWCKSFYFKVYLTRIINLTNNILTEYLVLRKNNCLKAIRERPAKITGEKWNELTAMQLLIYSWDSDGVLSSVVEEKTPLHLNKRVGVRTRTTGGSVCMGDDHTLEIASVGSIKIKMFDGIVCTIKEVENGITKIVGSTFVLLKAERSHLKLGYMSKQGLKILFGQKLLSGLK
ncbi:hypothetical protein WN944_029622 [Citrus x changshan-huyou]|uniref:Uncharacterized protein n=1 Tax=Citrus x changshan-huyou TaxID=2935761 RepID=A0AAP0LMK9_9ROSI